MQRPGEGLGGGKDIEPRFTSEGYAQISADYLGNKFLVLEV